MMKYINNLKEIEQKVKRICDHFSVNSPDILIVTKYVGKEEIHNIHSLDNKYHFGENSVDSLIEKSEQLAKNIKWHFIGNLQSNKCKNILKVKNLYMIETLDKEKKATLLNNYLKIENELNNNNEELRKLCVLMQIKTTDDETKTGLTHQNYDEIENTVLHIINNCQFLIFKGLMTISSLDINKRENSFVILNDIKRKLLSNQVINNYFLNKTFHMSMGMSDDMELAIKHETTQLRIGRAIFN
ncbi:pyridoxal 5'-phosphate dependent enzyme class III [Plasmodium falciparum NF54]|uniref:Pyridoxal phosphate homeostasis protein n=2 Tax=Plasmodium falciparum TaxID=5833 RepID=Q8I2V6_PLAF7|nr:pyridoxal phosphate homeostasis protein, putative [Plasmodium falciparum 3D7]EWC85896.1 YggS family pyridoxal phosphate enzyme [Plasmodium falciparum NF54]KAF4330772.1 pyridoxal 5'-phosphate dependent enzyme class III [Plasmodium falciparum NF54]PKC44980.1 pyridoxal 5'-phosphate dependent enzyme class III [Plasmodium falciparum NF54]CAD51879.1 pyridoxal phosphate homeostasis protein, putative [Plasmodium falciparum 3D7]|eukprot:XP_001352068.1 pyridoxal 5'-phosphate dependent enzyme class III, putative [Plasmodium falciparum 3D7]